MGDSTIALDRVAAWVETDRPLVPYAAPAIGEVERRIAAHVAEIVPDGATIQVGIGATPEAVVSGLGGHRDLGVHSALFDAMLPLLERGVITGARNRRHPGCLDLGEIMGTEPLVPTGSTRTRACTWSPRRRSTIRGWWPGSSGSSRSTRRSRST